MAGSARIDFFSSFRFRISDVGLIVLSVYGFQVSKHQAAPYCNVLWLYAFHCLDANKQFPVRLASGHIKYRHSRANIKRFSSTSRDIYIEPNNM